MLNILLGRDQKYRSKKQGSEYVPLDGVVRLTRRIFLATRAELTMWSGRTYAAQHSEFISIIEIETLRHPREIVCK